MPWISGAIIGGASLLEGIVGNKAASSRQGTSDAFQREYAQNSIQWRVNDAQQAGVHPLYAMGAQTQSYNPGFQTGSGVGDAIRGVGRGISKSREDWLEAQIENTKAKTAAIRANATQDNVIPIIHNQAQEIEKGQVQTHSKKHPERNLSVKSPMTRVRIGSQTVWVPTDEVDTFMEDPLAVGLLTYSYHGNKNINWKQLINEYRGKKPTPAQVTKGTKKMFKRMKKSKAKTYPYNAYEVAP